MVFISAKVLRHVPQHVPQHAPALKSLVLTASAQVQAAGLTPFVAYQEIAQRRMASAQEFMPFVRQKLLACELCLVMYHPELRGGLIEMGMAYAAGIPIWLCCQPGEPVSSSARGCANLVLEYSDPLSLSHALRQPLELFMKKRGVEEVPPPIPMQE